MLTLVPVPIFFLIFGLSFLPLSHHQQTGLVLPPNRPTQQQRQQVRGNPNLKLIFNNRCGNSRWFAVRRNQCPIAFNDPTFLNHRAICNDVGFWAQLYPRSQVGQMYVFNTGPAHRGNRIRYCANVPIAFSCPALARCPNNPFNPINPVNPINPIFPINPINPNCACSSRTVGGMGRCQTRDNDDILRRYFCYVNQNTVRNRGCRIFPSQSRPGWFYSYAACPNNFQLFPRGGREEEDEEGFERSGEFIEDDASGQEDVDTDGEEFVLEIHDDDMNEDTDVNSNIVYDAP